MRASRYWLNFFNGESMATLKELLAQQEALSKQIEETRAAAKSAAIEQVRQLIADNELTASDVFGSGKSAGKKKATGTVAIKYRDPQSGKTWTGRGKAPRWLDGKNKDDFLVK